MSGSLAEPLGWKRAFLYLALAVLCFQAAYAFVKIPVTGFFIFGYACFLIQLTNQPTVRRAFYFGLAVGFAGAAGQAFFFWKIFSAAAIFLWLVFGFWIGLFTAISCGCIRRWGMVAGTSLIPVVWTGTEYFRSELYYLKFSWLNVGYALANVRGIPVHAFGMYGVGFLVFLITSICAFQKFLKKSSIGVAGIILAVVILLGCLFPHFIPARRESPLNLVGVQMEFPPEHMLPLILNQALAKNTNASIFVMSEYTLDSGPLESLTNWCRQHSRFLIVGGKDVVTNEVYYDTAFVIGTNGEIVFKQAKSVPIQFFKDGLPSIKQDVWNSPWGKIGICICYDLSYTRVTDGLVRKGAQLMIVPTMDVEEWGKHEHGLHARVAPVRAAEYEVPIFRVASSGISQAVSDDGTVVAHTSMPGNGEIFSAQLRLPAGGERPLDRFFAPACVGASAAVLASLLFLSWKDKRFEQKNILP